MSSPESEPEPEPTSGRILVSHESAAITQLETAISLWFTGGDPISIHNLASDALQILHDQGSKIGKPSEMMLRIQKLPDKQKRRAMFLTAFTKHADRRMPHNAVEYPPELTEEVIYEAVCCCWKLFDDLTPWMKLFSVRYIAMNVQVFEFRTPYLLEFLGGQEHLARLSLREFLEEVVPILSREDFWMTPPEEPGQT